MNIAADKTVREIVLQHPVAARVFDKIGIDYCCGGRQSLREACAAANLSVEEVLRHVALAPSRSPADQDAEDWSAASLSELMEHIVSHHHAYLREEMPRLAMLSRKVVASHAAHQPPVMVLDKLLQVLFDELNPHMLKEEQVLFPHVREMEEAVTANQPVPRPFFGTVQSPISAMTVEHDGAGELLRQIRKTADDFKPPADACTTFVTLYKALEEFEHDLHRHIHLENNILFPRALQMESVVAQRA